MAISFKDKIAYVNKYAPKDNDKVQKLIKYAVNIDSQKLNLSDAQKSKVKEGIDKAFDQIKEKKQTQAPAAKAPKASPSARKRGRPKGSTKASKAHYGSSALKDFKKKIGRKAFAQATHRTTVPIDMERPAVKPGKRIVRKKGETSNQYGTFSNKVGRKYWENRANRIDINQPSKKRYPKLAKGARLTSALWWENAPKKVREEAIQYFANKKMMWNRKEIQLSKSDIQEIQQVQKIVSEKYPEYNNLFHSKLVDGGMATAQYRIVPNKEREVSGSPNLVEPDYGKAFTISGSLSEANQEAQKFVKNNQEVVSAVVTKIHPSGQALKNKKVSYVTKDEVQKYEDGGNVEKGAASLLIKMNSGNYVAYAGADASLKKDAKPLFNRKNAPEGTWKKIIQELRGKYGEGGRTINLGSGDMTLDEAIDMYEKKIKAQGNVSNERDENMLRQLKEMKKEYADGGSIAKGNYEMVLSKAKELHHHTNELQEALKKEKNIEAWVVAKVERASQDLSDVTHYLDGTSEYAQGGTLAGGGYVAVGEKDGYWTIISKPSTKENAQKMLDLDSLPRGESGKVVTVEEAKAHKKVIGREYLAYGGTLAGDLNVDNIGFGLMAKGGKLRGKQRNLDVNHNRKLDKEDFQMLRSGKRIVRKNKK